MRDKLDTDITPYDIFQFVVSYWKWIAVLPAIIAVCTLIALSEKYEPVVSPEQAAEKFANANAALTTAVSVFLLASILAIFACLAHVIWEKWKS